MPKARDRLLNDRLREAIPDLIRIRAGRIPGTELLDLYSTDGFVAERLARKAEDWVVHAAVLPEDVPGNVEDATVKLPDLPFEDGELAAVVAAAIDAPLERFDEELLAEVHRVLVPEGRFIVAFRGASARRPDAARTLPEDAVDRLEEAGFDPVMETFEQHLRDGSELRLVRAVKPAGDA